MIRRQIGLDYGARGGERHEDFADGARRRRHRRNGRWLRSRRLGGMEFAGRGDEMILRLGRAEMRLLRGRIGQFRHRRHRHPRRFRLRLRFQCDEDGCGRGRRGRCRLRHLHNGRGTHITNFASTLAGWDISAGVVNPLSFVAAFSNAGSRNNVKVLQSNSIITTHGKQGEFIVSQQQPIIQGSTQTPSATEVAREAVEDRSALQALTESWTGQSHD